MQESTLNIIRRASRFFSGSSLSRITGLLRDMVTAALFGATPLIGAFYLSLRMTQFARRLLGESGMQAAFTPLYEEQKGKNPTEAAELFTRQASLIALLLFSLSLLAFAYHIVTKTALLGSSPPQLVTLMLPGLAFTCLYGLNLALLHSEGSFFLTGLAPAFCNLTWILTALLVFRLPSDRAIALLAVGYSVGSAVQWLVTLPAAHAKLRALSWSYHWYWPLPLTKSSRRVYHALKLSLLGLGATQINSVVDAFIARWAAPEGPALLWYAIRIQQLPIGLIGVALSSALLPALTRGNHHLLRSLSRLTLFVTLPFTLFLLFFGENILQLLYAHGRFSPADVQSTYLCLAAYALGITPMILVLLLTQGFYAQQNWHRPAKIACATVGLNTLLSASLVGFGGFGPEAVALATSLSAFFQLGLLWRELMWCERVSPTLPLR